MTGGSRVSYRATTKLMTKHLSQLKQRWRRHTVGKEIDVLGRGRKRVGERERHKGERERG
ncbi:MAG: hypothetical protein MJE68_01830 [Proteobacteria bacterium]|nr:hypothetical protein [Pseudomonadota bacterium]